ncbi:MAG: Zinc transporter ZupT [Promethearchaeota archaeon]|jgi:ZIP family zinc transporter|nr:MAG: Zinc transporter ZupT [Candidatus Lokiarchaeota archaeon]
MELILYALILTLFAGLSTTFGSIIAIFIIKPNPNLICIIMGFSAGVMILVSFVELLQEGINSTTQLLGFAFFMIGMIIMLLVDVLISHTYEFETSLDEKNTFSENHKMRNNSHQIELQKASLLVTLGIMIHNFPEGMATFVGTLKSVELGIILAIAIAVHNIPEGIAVSVPIYSLTGSRKKAFLWSFLSGISEFIGALISGFFLFPFINEFVLGAMLSVVGGFMVYISLDELLPVSHSYGKEHLSIIGIMLGMTVMGLSLVIV